MTFSPPNLSRHKRSAQHEHGHLLHQEALVKPEHLLHQEDTLVKHEHQDAPVKHERLHPTMMVLAVRARVYLAVLPWPLRKEMTLMPLALEMILTSFNLGNF